MSRMYSVSAKALGFLFLLILILIGTMVWLTPNSRLTTNLDSSQVATEYPAIISLQHDVVVSDQAPILPAGNSSDGGHHCITALDRSAPHSLNMYGSSSLIAPDCLVRSHSNSRFGVSLNDVELLKVAAVHSGGSFDRDYEALQFIPVSNSGDVTDPLAGIELPVHDHCDHQNLTLKEGNHRLEPGVYCGGLVSLTAEQIELAPGTYTIKNGPLAIGGRAKFIGEGVSLIFEGPDAVFSFGVATKLALKAPTIGPLAGIIFFEHPNAPKNRKFVVRSHDAEMLEGAIYLPRGIFIIDSYGRVGQTSSWSVIVANKVEIINGAHLQVNSNYAGSDVPLPDNLKMPVDLALASTD